MRFPLAAVGFIIAGFLFLAFFGFSHLVLSEVDDALDPHISLLESESQTKMNNLISLVTTAFGIIGAIFFVVGIILIFLLESLGDEPEYFYRRD